MAGQQRQFNPGVSLAGAVDLEALKHQVTAEPGQAGGAPAAGGYVIDTTENTFQAMVQTSATFPILLLLWLPTDDRLFPMAKALGDAVPRSRSCCCCGCRPTIASSRWPRPWATR